MNREEVFKVELGYIKSDRIKKACLEMIKLLPDYFFEIPASSTGKYHPEYALGDGGLLRHSKAAVRIGYELLEDPLIGGKYTSDEKDMMLMALLLHDGLKSGMPKEKYTRFDHPLIICDLIICYLFISDFGLAVSNNLLTPWSFRRDLCAAKVLQKLHICKFLTVFVANVIYSFRIIILFHLHKQVIQCYSMHKVAGVFVILKTISSDEYRMYGSLAR